MLVMVELDGVLMDLGRSSRAAAAQAAATFLKDICKIDNGQMLVKAELLDAFKRHGGFSDDCDLAYAVVYYVLASLPPFMHPRARKVYRASDITEGFRSANIPFNALIGHTERALEPTLTAIERQGGGLVGLRRAFPAGILEEYLLYRGEVGATEAEAAAEDGEERARLARVPENLFRRLFDGYYLGDAAFTARYGVPPWAPAGDGLRQSEALNVELEALERIAALGCTTLIADLPRAQTEDLTARLGLDALFPCVICEGERPSIPTPNHPLLKPDPPHVWALKHIVSQSVQHYRRSFEPRDVYLITHRTERVTASRAIGIRPLGFVTDRAERAPMREAGAHVAVSRLGTIVRALERAQAQASDG